MKVTMLLADFVQENGGKLYIVGGGWSVCGPGRTPMGIALKIEVPWDETNKRHSWRLALLDGDGKEVVVETPEGPKPVEVSGEFEVGRPPGLKRGTPLDLPLAVNIAPLPLATDSRYRWQLFIDDESHEDWSTGFTTRPARE